MQKVRTLARHGPAADFAKGKQPPSFAVVSESELQNLRAFLDHDPLMAVKGQQQERNELKQVSDERVKHWPNLIEALRLKKEQNRRERLEEEEEARKVVDAKEAEYQAQVRSTAIRKANQMLYEQDDKVKTFASKLFLSHVLDERAKQVELERNRKELAKKKDAEWDKVQQASVKVAREAEEVKVKEQREAAARLKREQKEQLEEIRQKKLLEREEARLEGKQIREAAERAITRERETEDMRRQKAIDINKMYIEDNKKQRVLREERMKAEEEELKKIQLFAQLKEEQMLERKRRAEEKFNAQLQARQAMIDRQTAHLDALAGEAEERVLTQIRDAEKEREQKESAEKRKRERMWEEIDSSRQKQLTRKEKAKQTTKEQQRRIQRIQSEQQSLLMDEEIAEREATRKRAEKLQAFQKLQIKEKAEKRALEREKELEEGLLMARSMEKEQEMFESYVTSVMGPLTKKRQQKTILERSNGSNKSATPPALSPQPPSG